MAHQRSIAGIETNPAVLGGKPVIAGTRIGVDLILEKSAMARQLMRSCGITHGFPANRC
jgi:uncharacterized protein (DUF433 family)